MKTNYCAEYKFYSRDTVLFVVNIQTYWATEIDFVWYR